MEKAFILVNGLSVIVLASTGLHCFDDHRFGVMAWVAALCLFGQLCMYFRTSVFTPWGAPGFALGFVCVISRFFIGQLSKMGKALETAMPKSTVSIKQD